MTLKIDYCSDLHVDMWMNQTVLSYEKGKGPFPWKSLERKREDYIHVDWEWYKNPDSSVLVIAGDSHNGKSNELEVLLDYASNFYDRVIFTDGNHEHYSTNTSVSNRILYFKEKYKSHPKITYLDGNNFIKVNETYFMGGCGWYDWKCYDDEEHDISLSMARLAWRRGSNDSRYPEWDTLYRDPGDIATETVQYFKTNVAHLNTLSDCKNIVVITHTSPNKDLMYWDEFDNFWNSLTPSYVNSEMCDVLNYDTKKKITHWIYGHTHIRGKKIIDSIEYVNNARGYPNENNSWKLEQIII